MYYHLNIQNFIFSDVICQYVRLQSFANSQNDKCLLKGSDYKWWDVSSLSGVLSVHQYRYYSWWCWRWVSSSLGPCSCSCCCSLPSSPVCCCLCLTTTLGSVSNIFVSKNLLISFKMDIFYIAKLYSPIFWHSPFRTVQPASPHSPPSAQEISRYQLEEYRRQGRSGTGQVIIPNFHEMQKFWMTASEVFGCNSDILIWDSISSSGSVSQSLISHIPRRRSDEWLYCYVYCSVLNCTVLYRCDCVVLYCTVLYRSDCTETSGAQGLGEVATAGVEGHRHEQNPPLQPRILQRPSNTAQAQHYTFKVKEHSILL